MAERRGDLFWVWFERLGPLVMLIALLAGFAAVEFDTFISLRNAKAILVQTAILASCTIGMTMIMVSGGLDLSVGSILAFSSVSGAMTYHLTGSPVLAGVACVIGGLVCGCANGLLIAGFRMNPFIVTLGMMGIARGIAQEIPRANFDTSRVYLNHVGSDGEEVSWVPRMLDLFPKEQPWKALGLPPGVFLTAAMIVVAIVVMRLTVFGRHIYAIGSNEESAKLCGIRVAWTKFAIYAIAGMVFGVAGLMQLSYDNAGNSTARVGFELNVIAAVVIGGASLSGGVGSIMGSVIGALIMVVLTNGCSIVGLSSNWQLVIIGVIIVAAVALDMFRQGKMRWPWAR